LRHDTGRQGIGEGREDSTIFPVDVEVIGPLSIRSDLFSHPFEKFGLSFESSSLNLESEDEGPNETKDELEVVVGDVFGSDADEFDAVLLDELEGERGVLELLRSDLGGLVVFGADVFAGDDLQEIDQEQSVAEIRIKTLDEELSILEEVVAPSGEGLFLDIDPRSITRLLFFGHFVLAGS